MRGQFFKYLIKLAEKDKDVIFLTGDLGFSFFEEFKAKFPNRFINCGIAEQNMVGVAAGLALGGKKPYVYSNSAILIFRAFEQIRDDVCYQNLNVKLIGVANPGFLGFTHNLSKNEDVNALKYLPNLKIFIPKSDREVPTMMNKIYKTKNPCYIRI